MYAANVGQVFVDHVSDAMSYHWFVTAAATLLTN